LGGSDPTSSTPEGALSGGGTLLVLPDTVETACPFVFVFEEEKGFLGAGGSAALL